ncbi:MAG TPA: GNAT family N-acetyltransferase, partial [Spirochaetota bacterium]|nr:GNAT family N-acetyltransferase [Spirochaetota bacterium]
CRIEKKDYTVNIGYKTLLRRSIKQLSVLYGGIIGVQNSLIFKIFLDNAKCLMKKGHIDAIYFSHLNLPHHEFSFLMNYPSFFCKDRHCIRDIHYRITNPESSDDFFKRLGSKSRYNIKRSIRILENSFNRIEYKCLTEPDNVETIINDIESVASKTYQRGLKTGFTNNNEFHDRLAIASQKKILRAYILYINDSPVSFWLSFKYKDILFLDSTGYDPFFSDYEVGSALLIKLIEVSSTDSEIKFIDFGFGDASYKHKYSDISWEETTFYIFSPKPKVILLNIISSLLKSLLTIIKLLLTKYQIDVKIKRIWRKKIIQE